MSELAAGIGQDGRPTLDGFDPLSQDFLADPRPALEIARAECPVFYIPAFRMWAVTSYEQVARCYSDFAGLSSRLVNEPAIPKPYADRVPKDFFPPVFMDRDPPEHTAIRKAANKIFTRPRIAAMAGRVREIVDELIDRFQADGHCDLVQQFSYPLSARTSMHLIGIPEADLPRFEQLAEDLVAVLPYVPGDPRAELSEEQWLERWERIVHAREYFAEFVGSARERPRDDLASAFINARDAAGEPIMTLDQVVSYMLLVIFAGTDTTASFIGLLVGLFEANPSQREAVRAEPALMANAVEEGLRCRASSLGSMRVATRELRFGEAVIRPGEAVWLVSVSASHDGSHFKDPNVFDVRRANAGDHMAFGRGRHFCMGAPLARLETPIAIERLWERLPGFRLAPGQQLRYDPTFVTLLYNHLQVEWDT